MPKMREKWERKKGGKGVILYVYIALFRAGNKWSETECNKNKFMVLLMDGSE